MLQEMLALRPAPPSATHLHSLTHSRTYMYVYIYIYIYISLSICRGGRTSCNARVSKASIVSTYQTANAMHTLLHHVKRALFFPFLFLFFFGELYLLPHGWGGENRGLPRKQTVASILSQVTNKCFVGFFFDSYPYYLDFFSLHSRSIIIVVVVIIIILTVTSWIGNSAFFSIESLFAH